MILLTGRVKVPVPAPRHVRVRAPVDSDAGQVLPAVLPFDLGRVAKPPRVEARVPVVWQYATPIVVPDCRVAAVVPVLPIVLARRPPTRNRLIASGSANVSGAAAIHAGLAVPYAEQSILVSQSAAIGVSQPAGNTVGVAGSADVRARYTVEATNSIGVSGVASDRVRHTVSATQAVQVSGSGSGVRATYPLAASQTITTSGVGDVRPTVPLSATQDVSVSGAASTVPSVGSVNADASNDCEVTGSADVRARYTVDAANSVAAGGSASRDGITVPLAATQAIGLSETADARATYALTATQSVVVSESGVVTPSLAAAQAIAAAGSADARARYTLAAAGSAVMDQSATVAVNYGTPFSYADDFSGSLTTNWWRFSSYTLEYPGVSSGQFQPGGASTANTNNRRNGAVWKTAVPSDTLNYYVSALIVTMGGSSVSGAGVGLIVGANDTSDHYNTNGPSAVYCVISTSGWEIFAANTGGLSSTSTILASLASGSGTYAAGSTIRAEVRSGYITLLYGATVLASNVNAGAYFSGSKVGLAGGIDTARLDNFAASNL